MTLTACVPAFLGERGATLTVLADALSLMTWTEAAPPAATSAVAAAKSSGMALFIVVSLLVSGKYR